MPCLDVTPRPTKRRARVVFLVPALAGSLALAACTSSGSSGTSASSGPTSGSSATAPGPASSTPNASQSRIANANPLEYHPVSKSQAKKLEKIAVRAPGVQNIAYAPNSKTLDMFMVKSATTKQRVIADRVVNQVLHPAATPSSSKTKKHHKNN